jgi:hypothetical protein
MNKPLNTPQLSSAKPRCGLQSAASLIPRLIRQYELQAELRAAQILPRRPSPVSVGASTSAAHQATFAWYE